MGDLRETDLYEPVKAFLEGQGYSVKGEVGRCDLVAVKEDAEPVIVELKLGFTLPLVFQGLQRQTLSDLVYLAIPTPRGSGRGVWAQHRHSVLKLCRMLGLGLLFVEARRGRIEVMLDPAPYQPRKQPKKKQRLLGEFQRRVGDPNVGGGRGRTVVTAYRQDALRCAHHLSEYGPSSPRALRDDAGVEKAAAILQRDVYGWFERVERGIYAVTPNGETALETFADVVAVLAGDLPPKA
ncbi:MAG: hypothetical protein CMM46_17895 [Rhodospirillaceae bacterium]|mgnify:CR=1 FL=1|nr:hypothetical protein [Rhodospirillaceae bacterium]|tara:strand:+ start:3294 stop:4007 length:714 start_codon:yes stop_codon:yes gene_type:complete